MPKRLSEDALNYFREHGSRGGKKSSQAMTAAQRKARALKASQAAARARTKKKDERLALLAKGRQQIDEALAKLTALRRRRKQLKAKAKKAKG